MAFVLLARFVAAMIHDHSVCIAASDAGYNDVHITASAFKTGDGLKPKLARPVKSASPSIDDDSGPLVNALSTMEVGSAVGKDQLGEVGCVVISSCLGMVMDLFEVVPHSDKCRGSLQNHATLIQSLSCLFGLFR